MIRKELALRLPNNAGALAGVVRALGEERVNVLAMSLDPAGTLRLLVDNHVHAAATLRERRHRVTERDVLVVAVPNTAGALAGPLGLVADAGINVDYAYSGTSERMPTISVVLAVEDILKASAVTGI